MLRTRLFFPKKKQTGNLKPCTHLEIKKITEVCAQCFPQTFPQKEAISSTLHNRTPKFQNSFYKHAKRRIFLSERASKQILSPRAKLPASCTHGTVELDQSTIFPTKSNGELRSQLLCDFPHAFADGSLVRCCIWPERYSSPVTYYKKPQLVAANQGKAKKENNQLNPCTGHDYK